MKRAGGMLLLFISLFFVADELRSFLQSILASAKLTNLGSDFWLSDSRTYVLANALIYFAPFVVAGAILTWRAANFRIGSLLSALLGITVGVAYGLDSGFQPFTFITHVPRWLELLFWSNLYMPEAGSLTGAIAWGYIDSKISLARKVA